jgi:hypothetical protein
MKPSGDKFIIQLNSLSRMLLLSSLSACKFTVLHENHPLAEAIYENDLIDEKKLELLFQRVKAAEDGEILEFSLSDEILIYTAFDITCKSFLTNIADDLQERSHDFIEAMDADFSKVRSTLLTGCQIVMEGMRNSLKDKPEFMKRVNLLNTQLDVE